MKKSLAIVLLSLFSIGCSKAALIEMPPKEAFHKIDRNTSYAVTHEEPKSFYLTVRYARYTFIDKAAEEVEVAKSKFVQIAKKLSKERNMPKLSCQESDYELSTGYNGMSGVSTILIGNECRTR